MDSAKSPTSNDIIAHKIWILFQNQLAPIIWAVVNDGIVTRDEIRLLMDILSWYDVEPSDRNQALVEMYLQIELEEFNSLGKRKLDPIPSDISDLYKSKDALRFEHERQQKFKQGDDDGYLKLLEQRALSIPEEVSEIIKGISEVVEIEDVIDASGASKHSKMAETIRALLEEEEKKKKAEQQK